MKRIMGKDHMKPIMLSHFHNLFTTQERESIKKAPLFGGAKHPTWFPLFSNDKEFKSIDYCLNYAVALINETNGDDWLKRQKPRLLDRNSINNATASMAEIRVYGGLLEAGFEVFPKPTEQNKYTPDFCIDSHSGLVEIEVASKHQCEAEDIKHQEIYDAMNNKVSEFPEGVEYHVHISNNSTIKTAISEHDPGGAPNPNKCDDSIQTNLISRICGIKKEETQISGDLPAMLIIDLTAFGRREVASLLFSNPEQAIPLICGNEGLTSGALWYAMYGWSGAPVFEEGTSHRIRMRHEGRFRLSSDKKTKFSAVLFLLSTNVVFLENPWSKHRLPDDVRSRLCRYPGFNLTYSMCDWQMGDVEKQIELHRHMIYTMEQGYDEMQTFWRILR